jgi:hypothetical protein
MTDNFPGMPVFVQYELPSGETKQVTLMSASINAALDWVEKNIPGALGRVATDEPHRVRDFVMA